jgi:hypothetical protein
MSEIDITLENELKLEAIEEAQRHEEEIAFLEKQAKIAELEEILYISNIRYEAIKEAYNQAYLERLEVIFTLQKLKNE